MHEQYVHKFKAYKNVCWKKNTQANKIKAQQTDKQ
jgi:hypothetical protein